MKKTQEEFAEPLGLTGGYISKLEKEERLPSEQLMLNLENVYRLSRNWLEKHEGAMFINDAAPHWCPSIEKEADGYRSKGSQKITPLSRRESHLLQMFKELEKENPELAHRVYEDCVEAYVLAKRKK